MLAGAVLGERRRGRAAGRGLRVERQVGSVLQVVDLELAAVEDAPDAVEVRRLTTVAGRGEGEQFAVEVEAVAQHRDSLQRLERRAGEERDVRVADDEHAPAAAVQPDEVAVVDGLHQVAAHDTGHGSGVHVDHAGHRTGRARRDAGAVETISLPVLAVVRRR